MKWTKPIEGRRHREFAVARRSKSSDYCRRSSRRQGHRPHPVAAHSRYRTNDVAWFYCPVHRAGQHGGDRRPASLPRNGRLCHARQSQKHQPTDAEHLLPRGHRVISLFKRWLLGTHQGAIAREYLQDDLDEFTFRFNRRKSASPGKLFCRLAQQSVQVSPVPYDSPSHH